MTPKDRLRGGMTTLSRYGSDHYRRITKGRPRRARYQQRATTPGRDATSITTEGGRRIRN